jgi:hypothetical protein
LLLEHRTAFVNFLRTKPEPRKWDEWLASEAPIMASYRESPSALVAIPFGMVDETSPPATSAGMLNERIDGHGLLREFSAVPYEGDQLAAPVEMETVFRAAGLDLKNFAETPPLMLPRHAADLVRAWKGPHPLIPNTELMVEVASWKGRITQAQVEFPFYRAPDPTAANRSLASKLRTVFLLITTGLAGFFAILFARRNWLKERVDKKGALRIAIASFSFGILVWIGQVHPIPDENMFNLFVAIVGDALFSAATVWLLYLALEPAVRARWPHAIVTWNRILAGQWKDAQVGSHILIGAALGTAMWSALWLTLGNKNQLDPGISLWPLLGARQWAAAYIANLHSALTFGLLEFFTIFGLRQLLKKDWLAAIAAAIVFSASQSDILSDPDWQKLALTYVVLYSMLMFVLLRVGLVTTISAMLFLNAENRISLGGDFKAWWAPQGFATIFLLLAVATYVFWRSLGTREPGAAN